MAHVLLPCELPFWPDVQTQMAALRRARDVSRVVEILRAIYRICSAAVEQVDEDRASEDEMRFDLCESFLEDFEDTSQLLDVILPTVVDFARKLADCRPQHFVYSLQAEEGSWDLSREFVASLLAHSFLSTYPLRTLRSHPTLQDFNRCSTYRYFTSDQHKRSLTNLLRYFKEVRCQMDGHIRVYRRILTRCPPLTEWVCGGAPLCPLTVRHIASIDAAEPHLYRVLPLNADIAVLKNSACAENEFLLEHPELSVLQLFCEALKDNEVLVVEGLRPLRVQSKLRQAVATGTTSSTTKSASTTTKMTGLKATTAAASAVEKTTLATITRKTTCPGRATSSYRKTASVLPAEEYQLNSSEELGRVGLLDAMSFEREFLYRQYLDQSLLFNLNKCLNVFQQATRSTTGSAESSKPTLEVRRPGPAISDNATPPQPCSADLARTCVSPAGATLAVAGTQPQPLVTSSKCEGPDADNLVASGKADEEPIGGVIPYYSPSQGDHQTIQATQPIHRSPHIFGQLSEAGVDPDPDPTAVGEVDTSGSQPAVVSVADRPIDVTEATVGDATSDEDSPCLFTLGSTTNESDRRLSSVGQSGGASSGSDNADDDDQNTPQRHSIEVKSGRQQTTCGGGGVVARHLLTDNLLQTQVLLNSPKHPSPRPRKRTVSGSTSTTGADDSEATLLSRPLGQPLILPRPAQGQPLGVSMSSPLIIAQPQYPAYTGKRPASLAPISRAQIVLSAPPVSSPRRIPSLQSEDSRGSFRTDSCDQQSFAYRPSRKLQQGQTGIEDEPTQGSAFSGCPVHRSLSKMSKASSFKTTFSKRYSRQVSAEDDYFTAEESFDEDEDDDDADEVDEEYGPVMLAMETAGMGSAVTSHRRALRRTRWATAHSRSSRTVDSELERQLSVQSSAGGYSREASQGGAWGRRALGRESSTGSAGFVLDHRSACSRLTDSDIASSAGRLFYRERGGDQRCHSQYVSVDSAAPANGCTCVGQGVRLKGGARRTHRQVGGLRATQGQSSKSRSVTHRSFDRRHSSDCSSCGGSSMEDIVEDPELLSPMLNPLHPLCSPLLFRRANSEPCLTLATDDASCFASTTIKTTMTTTTTTMMVPPRRADNRCVGDENTSGRDGSSSNNNNDNNNNNNNSQLSCRAGVAEDRLETPSSNSTVIRREAAVSLRIAPATMSHARLGGCRLRSPTLSIWIAGRPMPKAYSFDGVNPNLPVPFKAKFRIRKKRSPSNECDLSTRHALTKEDLDYIKRVVREDNRPRSLTESQDSSRIQEMQRNNELNQKISPSLAEGPGGMLPVACTRWVAEVESETDAQLEALCLWLAASAAGLPHLVIYTHGESRLQHLSDVCSKAIERHWLCGDLAGELVRFCRNKMSIHRGVGRVSTELSLFMQILQPSKPS